MKLNIIRSRRSYRFLGMNKGVDVSCSLTQHSTPAGFEPRTSQFGVRHSTVRSPRSLLESQLLSLIIVSLRVGGASNRALKLKVKSTAIPMPHRDRRYKNLCILSVLMWFFCYIILFVSCFGLCLCMCVFIYLFKSICLGY